MDANIGYKNLHGDANDSEEARSVHVPPTSKEIKWSHIEDLDFFFTKLYTYYQRRGFYCILIGGVLELVKVLFMLVFCVFLIYFIDYDVLFRKKLPRRASNSTNSTETTYQKLYFNDIVCPAFDECFKNINALTWMCIIIVLLYCFFRLIKLLYNTYHFLYIKGFFNVALRIPDHALKNITWHEVLKKICEAQKEYKMCIQKKELTELDIYHRILRSKNFMVAMVNKSVLPIHHNFPLIGNVAFMSRGLKYNIELLLFSGPWGFFENWTIKPDYKKSTKRHELAAKLKHDITWFTIGNLILSPFIFVWQLVYFLFNYGELLKREPSMLALRCWSLYARLYLRHFNELDHELESRLKRAYRPAFKYMNTFSSPMMVVIADPIIFISGAILSVIFLITCYDNDVLTVGHTVTVVAILTALLRSFAGFVPDENMAWVPEALLSEIISEIHYVPDTWRNNAHTTFVRDQFAQFFQYKATYLLFELISPFITPIILYFKLRPRSLEIIDFYRHYTIDVRGVGDVCTFSLMDMYRHGNPAWQAPDNLKCEKNNRKHQAEDGKTELSLIHFKKMNPSWHPPAIAEEFIHEVQERKDDPEMHEGNNDLHSEALMTVSVSLSKISPRVSVNQQSNINSPTPSSSLYFNAAFGKTDSIYRRQTAKDDPLGITIPRSDVEMSLSALYLHKIHQNKRMSNSETSSSQLRWPEHGSINECSTVLPIIVSKRNSDCVTEGTPLLKNAKLT